MTSTQLTAPRRFGRALLTFVAFPAAGTAAHLAVGGIDGTGAALAGGLIAGAILGGGQALGSAGRLDPARSAAAGAVGLAAGLTAGGELVGYGTSVGELAVMGALSGLGLGAAQALAAGPRRSPLRRAAFALATPLLWAAGWAITTSIGVDVDERWAVFGSSGALVAAAGLGAMLEVLAPAPAATAVATGTTEAAR